MNKVFKRLIPISVIITSSLLFSVLSILAGSLKDETLAYQDPEWSPDGSRIVLISNRNGNYDIYMMNADGSNQINVTSGLVDEKSPVWSPDGGKIVYLYSDYQDGSIRLMRPDGSDKKILTSVYPTWHTRFSWSPDSSAITYSSLDNQIREGKKEEIILLDIYTSNQNRGVPGRTGI